MMDTCKIDGCDNRGRIDSRNGKTYLRRGMCHKHYEKWRRRGDATAPDARGRKANVYGPTKVCKTCKVEKDTQQDFYKNSNGWVYVVCKTCHNKMTMANHLSKKVTQPPRVKVDHGPCAFDGCGRQSKTQLPNGPVGWYCGTHYNQYAAGKELHPVRNINKTAFKSDKFRQCTVCLKVHPVDYYHTRTNGRKQAVCKGCAVKQARFHALKRDGRLEEALEIAQGMAEGPREKFVGIASTLIREAELERSNGDD